MELLLQALPWALTGSGLVQRYKQGWISAGNDQPDDKYEGIIEIHQFKLNKQRQMRERKSVAGGGSWAKG